MASLFDQYAAEEEAKDKQPSAFDKYAAEEEERERAESANVPSPSPTAYSTTTATTPAEARKEAAAKGKEELRADEATSRAGSAGYGFARGLTMGTVDRGVGIGAMLGEKAGTVLPLFGGQTGPEAPDAYSSARADYLRGEDRARSDYPLAHFGGEVAGSVPPAIGMGPLAPAARGGRFVPPMIQGGIAGAFNTREDDPAAMAKGAAAGAGMGIAGEASLGTLFRGAIRGAPKRRDDAVIRDVMESEAGRANLKTAGFQIANDIDDINYTLKEYPEVAKAARLPATEALPVVRKAIKHAYSGQKARYAQVDKALTESGNELTVEGLVQRLNSAKAGLDPKIRVQVQAILDDMVDDLVKVHAPEWARHGVTKVSRPGRGPMGEPVSHSETAIKMEDLREWVTAAQDRAAMTMGKINGTATYKVPQEAAVIANGILEDQLDKAWTVGMRRRDVGGVMKTVDAIRESDRKTSALLAVSAGIKDRGQKESLQAVGLGGRLASEHRKQELAAAAGLAATGHPGAAAALVAADPARRGLAAMGRAVNERALAPLQEAAQAGSLGAQLGRGALESGLPQGGATASLNALRGQGAYVPPDPAPPPLPPPGQPGSDWRASTATR